MRKLLALAVILAGCKTVVTTTTEIRPSRYAVLEFTRAVSHDSIVVYARRAAAAENLKIQSVDPQSGTVTAGPVKVAATGDLPALDALVTISAETNGATSKIRITATAVLEPDQVGGVDARLSALAQRIEERLDVMIGH